jgi:hypothetical protein
MTIEFELSKDDLIAFVSQAELYLEEQGGTL